MCKSCSTSKHDHGYYKQNLQLQKKKYLKFVQLILSILIKHGADHLHDGDNIEKVK